MTSNDPNDEVLRTAYSTPAKRLALDGPVHRRGHSTRNRVPFAGCGTPPNIPHPASESLPLKCAASGCVGLLGRSAITMAT